MEYTRSPPPRLVDLIFRPIFLRSVPERKPRTERACQPAAPISSAKVAPLDFSRRAMTWALLLPSPGVAVLALGRRFGAFLPRPGFRVDLGLVVAAGGLRAAGRALPDSAGSKAAVGGSCCCVVMSLILPLGVVTAVTTFMALIERHIKRNLKPCTRAPGRRPKEWRYLSA